MCSVSSAVGNGTLIYIATSEVLSALEASWNVTAPAQKTDFVFRKNGRVHLNRRGRQLSRLVAAEVCESAVVMLDTPCTDVVWRVLATHSIRQFPLHFPSRASPCDVTFQLESTMKISLLGHDNTQMANVYWWFGRPCLPPRLESKKSILFFL